jgi:two-component system LytT family sensor kinase
MHQRKIWKKHGFNGPIIIVILVIAFMIFAIGRMYSMGSGLVHDGKVDLSKVNFNGNKLVPLDGEWEFYWEKLFTSVDFISEPRPQMDTLMKVPGSWKDREAGTKVYPDHGIATYRVCLNYPSNIKDPALRIRRVSTAFKLYVNGDFIVEVGKVSDKPSEIEIGKAETIVDLPRGTEELELIIQVANLDYSRGGLRESPVFGSKKVIERNKIIFLMVQMFFIGSIFIFGIYYLLLFVLQRKNKTALLFSLFCFSVASRSLVWGETPLVILWPNVSFNLGVYINYITGYNIIPILMLLVLSMYPLEYKKWTLAVILLPNLLFEALLLTPIRFMTLFNDYHFLLVFLQMIYILGILIKAVFHKRSNAILMFIAIVVFVLAHIADLLNNKGVGSITISYMFLYGNFAVIIAMSFIQARQQADVYKKLILYNEKLVEADILKDKILIPEGGGQL